ncbi:MAG TPA: type II toxin-antitoxin system HicB family antitoxin [Ktedonobacteraceae bacterium]|nr:type II toxin-antitoxin system HicB family antitoxin [Ktedonobacteraceae bacterium]
MTSTIKYKGYTGRVEFDAEDNILFGEVIGLRDIITFQGTTVEEIVKSFHKSVDTYLNFCKEENQQPEKPFSGKIPFRTTPEIHYRIYMAAQLADRSINAWMNEVLADAAQRTIAASEESEVVLPTATAPSAERLADLIREVSASYRLPAESGQQGKEQVPAVPSWPGVAPVRFIDPRTRGKLVAEETTQKVAQEETPVSEEKLHDLVADATQTAIEKIKESAPGTTGFIPATPPPNTVEPLTFVPDVSLRAGKIILNPPQKLPGKQSTSDIMPGTGVKRKAPGSSKKPNINTRGYSG